MARQLHNEGELFVLDNDLSNVLFEIGLYNDATDSLVDSDTYSAITTEPSGAAYSPQTQASVTIQLDGNNNGQLVIDPVTFDVSDSSQTVDSIYIRDEASGDFIATNAIGTEDLSTENGSLRIANAGFNLD